MENIDIAQLKSSCNFLKKDLESEMRNNKYCDDTNLTSFFEILLYHTVFEKCEEYNIWLEKANLYFGKFKHPDDATEYDINYVKIYFYYLTLFNKSPNTDIISKYCDYKVKYFDEFIKLKKNEIGIYEKLIVELILAKQYDKALDYCNKICELKPKGLVNSLKNFLVCKVNNDEVNNSIIEIKKELNKKRSALTHVITDGMAYFFMYYFELSNNYDIEKALRACYYGIEK